MSTELRVVNDDLGRWILIGSQFIEIQGDFFCLFVKVQLWLVLFSYRKGSISIPTMLLLQSLRVLEISQPYHY